MTTPALPCNVDHGPFDFKASPPVLLTECLNPSANRLLLCIDSASHERHEAAVQPRRIGMLPNSTDLAPPALPLAAVRP